MRVPVSLQPYSNQMPQTYDTGTGQSTLSNGHDQLFSDLLQEKLANGQRVITSQEILAELDGSPEWNFANGAPDRYAEASESGSAGRTAAMPSKDILEKIDRMANRVGVDKDLVREVVRAESNFDPNVVSHAGAKGLMQLMDQTAKAMHVRNVYNPDENLAGGTKYLKTLLDRYDGNVKVALAAYNAGPGRVGRLGIDTDADLEAKYDQLPLETQRYVEKIMNRLEPKGTTY
ncbi:lytic transglycosylase domain-containing protein [Brevibacillus sp. NRS-1366]|uniref:lytic transglycosylase domain-containing protein n=1 Tax=Brevibacillus sp. NRS-1366 TaxID=3233899 RepID=UPI003D21C662